MNDDPDTWLDEHTEATVRQALVDHAESVEPSPDAYATIAARVATSDRHARSSWAASLPVRIAVFGMVTVAAVGGGALLVSQQDSPADQPVAGIDDPSDSTAVPSTSSASAPPSTSTASSTVPSSGLGEAVGPVRPTKIAAAEAFLDLVGVSGPTRVEEAGSDVIVRGFGEGGEPVDRVVARLELVEGSSGWSVASATSDTVIITSPAMGSEQAGTIEVAGLGGGFERAIDIVVRSTVDGTVLGTSFASGGQGEPEPYETTVGVVGTDRAWVIATSGGGADNVAEPFAAVQVSIEGPPDTSEYRVATVPIDDPDGGLNVRAEPDASSVRLTVAPWASSLTRTPGQYPVRNGDAVWWPVATTDGITGWVNARFVAKADMAGVALTDEELTSAASNFLFVASFPDAANHWFQLSKRVGFTVVVDGQTIRLPTGQLAAPTGWSEPVIGDRALAELLDVPDDMPAADLTTPDASALVSDVNQLVVDRYFAGLPSVLIRYEDANGRPRNALLFFEASADRARYVGVIIDPAL